MTLSRRSFLRGLAALPLVAALLPKEVPAKKVTEFSVDSEHTWAHKEYAMPLYADSSIVWDADTGNIPVGSTVYFKSLRLKKAALTEDGTPFDGIVVAKNRVLVYGTH